MQRASCNNLGKGILRIQELVHSQVFNCGQRLNLMTEKIPRDFSCDRRLVSFVNFEPLETKVHKYMLHVLGNRRFWSRKKVENWHFSCVMEAKQCAWSRVSGILVELPLNSWWRGVCWKKIGKAVEVLWKRGMELSFQCILINFANVYYKWSSVKVLL